MDCDPHSAVVYTLLASACMDAVSHAHSHAHGHVCVYIFKHVCKGELDARIVDHDVIKGGRSCEDSPIEQQIEELFHPKSRPRRSPAVPLQFAHQLAEVCKLQSASGSGGAKEGKKEMEKGMKNQKKGEKKEEKGKMKIGKGEVTEGKAEVNEGVEEEKEGRKSDDCNLQ